VRDSREEEEKEGGSGKGGSQGPLATGGRLYLDICAGAPDFLVMQLLMVPVCLFSQGRFKQPV